MDVGKLIYIKKNEKNWILNTVDGKHLLNFSDFFNLDVLQKFVFGSLQLAKKIISVCLAMKIRQKMVNSM